MKKENIDLTAEQYQEKINNLTEELIKIKADIKDEKGTRILQKGWVYETKYRDKWVIYKDCDHIGECWGCSIEEETTTTFRLNGVYYSDGQKSDNDLILSTGRKLDL